MVLEAWKVGRDQVDKPLSRFICFEYQCFSAAPEMALKNLAYLCVKPEGEEGMSPDLKLPSSVSDNAEQDRVLSKA